MPVCSGIEPPSGFHGEGAYCATVGTTSTESEPCASARNVICIGASAGGVEALSRLVGALPRHFGAPIFVVQHMPRNGPGLLPTLLARAGMLPVVVPDEPREFEPGTVYLPPPDHHIVINEDHVWLTRGPTQNRHRPSIDVLFRSAAAGCGPRAVGVVLTGVLDDGSAGLLAIKRRGGVAVVQDPSDALFSDMPENAARAVDVDHCVSLAELAPLLMTLARSAVEGAPAAVDAALTREQSDDAGVPTAVGTNASPSPFSCPECHGVLWRMDDNTLPRFRCRVGHGFSIESLAQSQDEAVEQALWAAARSLEERAALSRNMAEQWRLRGLTALAQELTSKADGAQSYADKIRELIGISSAKR